MIKKTNNSTSNNAITGINWWLFSFSFEYCLFSLYLLMLDLGFLVYDLLSLLTMEAYTRCCPLAKNLAFFQEPRRAFIFASVH